MREFIFDLRRFKTINNTESYKTITGTSGNDRIINSGVYVDIYGEAGNDYIRSAPTVSSFWSSSIYGGTGNDTISTEDDSLTIDGGLDNDFINLAVYHNYNVIVYDKGDGNDTIVGFNSTDTLSISGGSWSTAKSNNDVIVTVGNEKITLQNACATADSLHINNKTISLANTKLLNLTSGNDSIQIYRDKITINGGAGNDSITNYYGNEVLINCGKGADYIYNSGNSVTVDGGEGNDSIYGSWYNRYLSINGGSGNDSIFLDKSNDDSSIVGGKGNDTITLYYNQSRISVFYNDGDGNDVIQGFNDSSTLKIGNGKGTYSTQASGNDVIVTVGKGKITLQNIFATANYFHINDDTIEFNEDRKSFKLTKGNDYIICSGESQTVAGMGGKDSLLNYYGWDNSLNGGAGNDYIRNYEASVTLVGGEGNDTIENNASTGIASTVDGGAGNDSIVNNSSGSSLAGGEGKDVIFNESERNLIDGGNGDDSLVNENYYNIINGGAGNDTIYNREEPYFNNGGYSTINGGAGNDLIINESPGVTILGGKGNDTIKLDSGDETVIQYKAGDGNDKIYDFKADSTLSIGGSSYSTKKNGSDVIVTVGNGKITLVGAADLSELNITNKEIKFKPVTLTASADDYTNRQPGATIQALGGNDTVWSYGDNSSISGGAGNDYIFNNAANVSVNGGAGNDSIATPLDATINAGKGDDSINLTGYSGYEPASHLILYKNGDGNDFIDSFDENDTLRISGSKYSTMISEDGDDVIVTVGKGKITLCGAAYCDSINIEHDGTFVNKWTLNGTTATYGTSDKTLVTVSGVKSKDGLSVSGKVVTVANSSLNQKKVTISNGYTLKLADDVNSPSTSKAWSYGNSKATYKQTTSAGYKLASNSKSINYSKAASKTLATVSGVKSKDGLSVSGTTITVSNAALNQKKVTVSNGYTLKLGSDVTKSTSKAVGWTKSGSTATYKTASTTAGYKLSNNQINYVKKSGGATLATVKGVKNTDGLSVNNKVVTLKKSSLNSKVTLGGSYSFNLASGDYKKTSIMGSASADVITSNGKNLSINGGKGNDTIKISGAGTTVTGGAGKDVFIYSSGNGRITDFKAEDTLRIGNGTGTCSSETSGKNLIVTVGDNKLTLTGAASLSSPNIAGTKKSESGGIVVDGKKVTLTEDYMEDSFSLANEYSTMLTVDASAVPLDIKITGNKLMNSILGGAGNDILIGGKGNDKLDGGEGSDIFVYRAGDGDDVIVNYAQNDRISIASDTINGKIFSTSGNDIVLTIGTGSNKGTITVKDAKDKIVTCIDKNGKEIGYYNAVLIEGKTATLTDKYTAKKFDVANYGSEIQTINASAVDHALSIKGNGKANLIIGTGYNDTLYGGTGGDTLQGGNGDDIFVYNKGDGDDVITDYEATDKIKIASGALSDDESYSKDDVIFKVKNGKIIVAGGNGNQITFIDKNDNVISNKVYLNNEMIAADDSLWFTTDDNNFDTDNQLSSIVKSSASAYSFDTSTDFTSLAQKNNFITYSGKK